MATNSGMVIGLEVCELYPDKDMESALCAALVDNLITAAEYDRAWFFWLS